MAGGLRSLAWVWWHCFFELLGFGELAEVIGVCTSVTITFNPDEPLFCVTIASSGGESGLTGINWRLSRLLT